jgi:predicted anti-sigma-YlaC factor YlaD
MNCEQVNKLLLSYLDDEVNPEEREAIQAHLSVCSGCRDDLGALIASLSISALLSAAADIRLPYLLRGLMRNGLPWQKPIPDAIRSLP